MKSVEQEGLETSSVLNETRSHLTTILEEHKATCHQLHEVEVGIVMEHLNCDAVVC